MLIMTKKECFVEIKKMVESAEMDKYTKECLITFVNNEIALLDKKTSKSREARFKKNQNGLRETILEVLMSSDEPLTVTEMMDDPKLKTYDEKDKDGKVTTIRVSNQKLTSVLTKMLEEKLVVKTVKKKKSYYHYA